MDGDASFGRWLRRRRKALDLTQDALAVRVGCAVATIRKIEADARRPSRQIAELLAEILAIVPDQRALFLQVARAERRTERLASPVAPADSAPISALVSRAPASKPLPAPLTLLVGRVAELAEIRQLLSRAECRLLTIVGPGGIGKTRLAIAAVAEQTEAFADGACFVALAPLSAPEFIVPAIAEALGFAFSGPTEPKMQLLNYVREKELLLVLDNVEHLLDGVTLFSEMLQLAPRVKLLITARERLNLVGEWLFDLPGLPVPPPGQTDHLEIYSALTLFVDRARRIRASFALAEQNRDDVARICQLVEGMPLGIELAAAWVPTLSCEEIAQEIERNIDFLAASVRDLPERHRSMRVVFDHSWKLLSEEEQRVLCQLSVFRGGFTREAAEQVAGASLEVLSALVTKSLLYRTVAGRYDVHGLVRQYVGRRLAEVPPYYDATYTYFSHYYADWLQRQEAPLFSAAQRVTLDLIAIEMENVRAALTWAATHQDWASLDKALDALFWFYMMRNRYEEAITMLEQWIAALRQIDAQAAGLADYQIALGHAFTVLGWHCVRFGQLGRAREVLEYSLGLLRSQNAPHVLADALQMAGMLHFQTGDYAQCEHYLRESLHLQRTLRRDVRVAQCHFFLSYASLAEGRLADARIHIGEALRLLKVTGEAWATIRCQALLTTIVRAQGDSPEAEHLARQTLALSRMVNDPWPEAQALLELGVLARLQGQPMEAQRQLRASIALFRELGELWSVARALNHLGDATYVLGDDTQAHRCFLEGLRTALAAQALPVALDALMGIAAGRMREGLTESALELLTQILSHPSSSQEAQDHAGRLRAEVIAQLMPQQVEAVEARIRAKTFEAVVAELLVAH